MPPIGQRRIEGFSRRKSREFGVDLTAPEVRDDRRAGLAEIAGRGGGCSSARVRHGPSSAHIARGRSGTCASEAACAIAGRAVPACRARAFFCPSVRARRMARREGGRSTTTPLPRLITRARGRTCVLSRARECMYSNVTRSDTAELFRLLGFRETISTIGI